MIINVHLTALFDIFPFLLLSHDKWSFFSPLFLGRLNNYNNFVYVTFISLTKRSNLLYFGVWQRFLHEL